MAKRRRGAQPGNQNARTHGLYSRALNADQRRALELAEALDPADLAREIALLRARLDHLLNTAPDRFDLLVQGLRALAHLVSTRHRLSPSAAEDLAGHIAALIEGAGAQLGLDETV